MRAIRIASIFAGALGALSITYHFLRILLAYSENNTYLYIGLVFLFLVLTPLLLWHRKLQNNKIKGIIDSYKGVSNKLDELKQGRKMTKGWGMNNSPFRERKSGLTWGGGNVKAANADRNTRRRFLKSF